MWFFFPPQEIPLFYQRAPMDEETRLAAPIDLVTHSSSKRDCPFRASLGTMDFVIPVTRTHGQLFQLRKKAKIKSPRALSPKAATRGHAGE